ncbi:MULTISPECIES: MoaD/ThiS family protein [Photorhabdus]|uniref:MoaD/ThiS family protein n=1 Tax=Photorhabdus kayaii TaxID=230088 RepID=A0ABX0B4F0_9GAMM|nr:MULTISPECIES: MoaD/ThiS family protein [Photorhabdus]MCC8374515.1 MoaD/ThiS family protein [Photorhabdus bodei]MCT8354349.1 MoaD/ThiS family protein [Photorhabdus kayaii]MDB6368627.1 MoaD/ThiS family protein [Photorhabdus bodei]NDL12459.1 hypothetical protein [Photorhabdus kayaii]NDL26043.1 hypothetical protein [Photorhabdus kayaii]
MIEISFPESVSSGKQINIAANNLHEILKEMQEQYPDIFYLIATYKGNNFKVKPFVTLFINNVMSVESNPVLKDGDRLSFDIAISGG